MKRRDYGGRVKSIIENDARARDIVRRIFLRAGSVLTATALVANLDQTRVSDNNLDTGRQLTLVPSLSASTFDLPGCSENIKETWLAFHRQNLRLPS